MSDSPPGLLRVLGAGLDSAAERLAKLSRTSWLMQTVSMRQFDIAEYQASFSDNKDEGFGVLFGVKGISFLVFLTAKSATTVCRAFLGAAYTVAGERVATAEIANIVINAVADAIGDATGDMLLLSAPRIVEGTRRDVMMKAVESFQTGGTPSPVVSQVNMMAESLSADCVLILLMTSELRARLETAGRRAAD